ncbi:MAG: VOC family protein [Sphingorhabdus sp.]
MKRFHINLKVSDLQRSKDYYSALFAAIPTLEKDDYIKWMLDDPYINFSIEPATGETGIAHVGIEAENRGELDEIFARIGDTGGPKFEEGETTCCYAQSEKNWTQDPDGVIWEAFYTDGQTVHYGKKPDLAEVAAKNDCCIPAKDGSKSEAARCC